MEPFAIWFAGGHVGSIGAVKSVILKGCSAAFASAAASIAVVLEAFHGGTDGGHVMGVHVVGWMSLGSLGASQCGPGCFLSPPVGFYGSRRWRGICACSLCVGYCGLGVGLGPCEVGIGLTVGLDRAGLVWHNRRRSVDWCSSRTMVGPRRRVGVVSGCRAAVLPCGLLTGWVDVDGCTRAGVR